MAEITLADKLKEELDRVNRLAYAEVHRQRRKDRWRTLFRRRREPVPFTAQPTPARRSRRTDLMVAALGITVGLICALFPWYIFFNPDKFGPPVVQFGGSGDAPPNASVVLSPQTERVGAPSEAEALPADTLDMLATGTTPGEGAAEEEGAEAAPVEQPFPAAPIPFHVVYIANGRAMVEDDSGFFIVQRGSVLPDDSTVASIEERNGRWVVVTSNDEVLKPTD